ncbi:MAG: AGE family epimerase/isomerase [Alphaproteobacteria bacterium]|nr:AGE family epimerase/isomerase [Alphaproteobacteria bacterium]
MPDPTPLAEPYAALRAWLCGSAFPLWSGRGVCAASGGFVERLDPDGAPLDEPQRSRLIGRQIYAFALAPRFGWTGPAQAMVQRGLCFLDAHCWTDAGLLAAVIGRDGRVLRAEFDLYDHAFVLLGLAAAAAAGPALAPGLADRARRLLGRMRARHAHPLGGFREAMQLANPHMHMLEAALAWQDVAPSPVWAALADEIAELCLARMLAPASGALLELFDQHWRARQAAIEPGHQFEWAWLLIRWGRARGRPDAIAAARRLVGIGEGTGMDPARGLAINALDPDLAPRDRQARLWPQTERIKGPLAIASLGEADAQAARDKAAQAAAGLARYLAHPVQGAWWEHIGPDGAPLREASRASSLYHIVCAVEELRRAQ